MQQACKLVGHISIVSTGCLSLPQVDLPGLRQRQLLLRHYAAVRRLAGAERLLCVITCAFLVGRPSIPGSPACLPLRVMV